MTSFKEYVNSDKEYDIPKNDNLDKNSEAFIGIIEHKKLVSDLMNTLAADLIKRAKEHDYSKLESPEWEIFNEYTPKLKEYTFGSDEYKSALKEMKVALDHHYEANRHHPEHFENGINDMTLIDIIEMLTDWYASTKRNKDGNIEKSITDICQKRFNYSNELRDILMNTVNEYCKK